MAYFAEVSNGTGVSIEPFLTENGHFGVTSISISEKLGGEMPFCYVTLCHDGSQEAKELMDNEDVVVEVKIKQDEVEIYSFKGFIVHRNITLTNSYTFNIAVVPEGNKDIATVPRNVSWENIPEAIGKLWIERGYQADIKRPFGGIWPPSQLDDIRVYQVNETDLEFISKICSMLKSRCVYGYTLDGLLVKDIVDGPDREGKGIEPVSVLIGGGEVAETTKVPRYVNRNVELVKPVKDPNKDIPHKEISKNFDVRVWNGKIQVIRKGNSLINKNRNINERILNSTLGLSLSVQSKHKILPYKLGDTVYYGKGTIEELPEDIKFIITELVITFNIANPETPADPQAKKGLTWEALIRSTRELEKIESDDDTV